MNIDYISIEKELREHLGRFIDSADLTAYHLGGVHAANEADRLRDMSDLTGKVLDRNSPEENERRHNENLKELIDLVEGNEEPLVISYHISLWVFTDQASDLSTGLALLEKQGYIPEWEYNQQLHVFTLKVRINNVALRIPGGCNITWYSYAQYHTNLNKAASQ